MKLRAFPRVPRVRERSRILLTGAGRVKPIVFQPSRGLTHRDPVSYDAPVLHSLALMTLVEIRSIVHSDLTAVDAVIRGRLKSSVPLVDRIAEHIIAGGGKRLRPLLVVLAGRACDSNSTAHVEAAAFIEFIHTATLLHDDVVDGSSMRRGRDTA